MNEIEKEYYELLKQHLARSYKELKDLRKKVDKKIVEINEIEELIETIEESKKQ